MSSACSNNNMEDDPDTQGGEYSIEWGTIRIPVVIVWAVNNILSIEPMWRTTGLMASELPELRRIPAELCPVPAEHCRMVPELCRMSAELCRMPAEHCWVPAEHCQVVPTCVGSLPNTVGWCPNRIGWCPNQVAPMGHGTAQLCMHMPIVQNYKEV